MVSNEGRLMKLKWKRLTLSCLSGEVVSPIGEKWSDLVGLDDAPDELNPSLDLF